jgi:hypothetical protein
MLREAIGRERAALEYRRDQLLAEASLRFARHRAGLLDPQADPYTILLFREDEMRFEAEAQAAGARQRIAECEAAELRATIQGADEQVRNSLLWKREVAKEELALAEARQELVDAIEAIRWREGDLESGIAERSENTRNELVEAKAKKQAVEAKIKEAEKALELRRKQDPSSKP